MPAGTGPDINCKMAFHTIIVYSKRRDRSNPTNAPRCTEQIVSYLEQMLRGKILLLLFRSFLNFPYPRKNATQFAMKQRLSYSAWDELIVVR
jgi:hypothetical protein